MTATDYLSHIRWTRLPPPSILAFALEAGTYSFRVQATRMSQTNGSISPQATGSGGLLLRVGSKNPFRSRLTSQNTGASTASIPNSTGENETGNEEHPPAPLIAAPSAQNGPRTSTPNLAVDKELPTPPLPPRRVGTLNSAASRVSPTTSVQASTSPTISPPPAYTSNVSPPESLSRIFAPPSTSGPPPTRTPTHQRSLSPPPASSPLPRSQTPPPLPSRRTSLHISSPSPPQAGRGRRLRSNSSETMRVLAEDLPPAYTPGPDVRHGEQTVDIGPIRPFVQDDTAALEESLRRRQRRGASGYPGATRQQGWGYGAGGRGEPGYMGLSGLLIELLTSGVRNSPGRSQHRPSFLGTPGGSVTTPIRPQMTGMPASPLRSLTPQSTGGSYISRQPTGTPPLGSQRVQWGQYPGQRSAPSGVLNVPPPPVHPLAPPSRRSGSSTTSAHRSFPEIQQSAIPMIDARPTIRANAGRPLLHDGQVLVYPLGYECPKCTSSSLFASMTSL
jgi:hypothetical protein